MNKSLLKKMKKKKPIGQGSSRIVYDIGKGRVLKVAKSQLGIRSNRTEVKMYKSSPRRIKKYLGRILSSQKKYGWVIMKKYSRKFPTSQKYRRKLFKLRSKFRKHGILPFDTLLYDKPKHKNLRVKRSGRIKIIDYGHFKYLRS